LLVLPGIIRTTTHAILESLLVLPLSYDECSIDRCDKQEFHDSAMIILVPQLIKETYSFVLEPNTCGEFVSHGY
jgi:hypothetical protein